ncbi:DUF3325 family protein [Pseudoteredinibacter isoporae]|uniref:DUF3325 domain-containing protein n=1 Tax=Pseudoteredinibacter isoporae TaxID=570281 RepID=A0A7X0MZV7_9GAMM|nr:hypothetical protein [Pseudoteredinibacter isoporae]NHO89085.1 DUF3325 domain-containing protein [Pseudoteredinibacter isoporae]NIB22304.1 DUF3325 domain-containing protein [Pseudoteredinibacter isoporae]
MFSVYAFILCLIGFFALAFAKTRHWKLLFARKLTERKKHALWATGSGSLIIALLFLKTEWGWALGLCFYAGLLSLSMFAVVFSLSYLENRKPKRLRA